MTTINNTCRSSRLPSLQHLARQTVAALAISIATALSAQVGPPQVLTGAYDIEDLGTLAGHSLATGINRRGDVAGYAYNSQQVSQAFHFDAPSGPAQYLAPISYGLAINDAGVLAGDRAIPPIGGGTYQAFRLVGNTEQLVPLLAGYPYSDGIAINNNNEVAGDAYTYMARRAYVNTSAGTLDLGTLGGNSYARGINDDTEVVGYSEPPGFVSTDPNWDIGHAFYWDQNLGMVDLNDLIYRPTPQSLANLYDFRKASAINRHHQIVGMAASPALNVIRAFRLDRQPDPTQRWPFVYAFNELGTLPNGGISYGLALNSGGTVVGTAYRDASGLGNILAALFANGRVFNLNDGLSPLDSAEWTLLQATGINDNGEMVGWGQKTVEGQLHAFKLTPRAHIVANVKMRFGASNVLGVSGRGFTPSGAVRVEVHRDDIGGPLVRSGTVVASDGSFFWNAQNVPCNGDLAINAWDESSGAFSNAAMVNISCR